MALVVEVDGAVDAVAFHEVCVRRERDSVKGA